MDDPTKTVSQWIDDLYSPIAKPTGQAFRAVGGGLARLIAPQYEQRVGDVAQRVGEGTPRFLTEALLYGSKRPAAKIAGLGDVLMRNYAESGDLPSSLGQTAAFAAAPAAGKVGESLASRLAPSFESPRLDFLAKEATKRIGSTAASLAPFEAASAVEAGRRGESYDPLSLENVVGTAASVLPFEAMHVPGIIKGFRDAPLVNQKPMSDIADSHRVDWEGSDSTPRSRVFTSQENAEAFGSELRKHGFMPTVQPAGQVPRTWVEHEMAFKPEQLQAGFGLKMHEVLNDMGDKEMPGKQVLGTLRNKVSPQEWDMVPGLEDWVKGQEKVRPEDVAGYIRENGPRVEVKELGAEGQYSSERKEAANLAHQLESRGYDVDLGQGMISFSGGEPVGIDRYAKDAPEQDRPALQRLADLVNQIDFRYPDTTSEFATARYTMVNPKPLDQMPGAVDLLVRIPVPPKEGHLDQPEVKYESVHYPTEGKNLLAHVRGYMETAPDGKKVFHVFEVQSDWGQERREQEERYKRQLSEHNLQDTPMRQAGWFSVETDPLLKHYNSLALKAALMHAVRNGADAVALSDAETAMMSEGHDRVVDRQGRFTSRQQAEQYIIDNPHILPNGGRVVQDGDRFAIEEPIPQEKGMRLNYDQILPRLLERLTGEKGKRVDFGEHQNAFEKAYDQEGGTESYDESQPRPDLIFKNPDGTPKTSITAQQFSLDRFKKELAKRGGIPIVGDKYISSHASDMQLEGYDPSQIVQAVNNIRQLPALPGETPLQALARSVGLDKKVFETMAPEQAAEKQFEVLTSMFHYLYGYEPNHAAWLARQVAAPLARFSPWLTKTKIAVVPGQEGAAKMYGLKEPKSEVWKYLIGVPDLPQSALAVRQSPEAQVFEVARTLGHEATHNMLREVLNPTGNVPDDQRRAGLRALAQVEAIRPDERAKVLERMLRLVVPPSKLSEVSKVNFERSAEDPEEFLADFASIIAVGSLDKRALRNMQDAMFFGDEASKDFSNAIYRDVTAVWKGVKEWLGFAGEDNKQVTKAVGAVYDNLTKLMATRQEAEKVLDGFNAYVDRLSSGPLDPPPVVPAAKMMALFRRIDPALAHDPKAMNFVNEALAWTKPTESPFAGERLSFWKDMFKPMGQLVETLKDKVPSVMPVFGLATDYRGLSSELQKTSWDLFRDDKGKVDWGRLRWVGRDGSPQNKAFNAIALVENTRTQLEDAKELMPREEREKLSGDYKGLSEEDKNKVDQSLEQLNAMGRFIALKKHGAFKDRVSWGMAKVIMSYNKELFHDKAKTLADSVVDAVFNGNPETGFAEADPLFAALPISPTAQQLLKQKIVDNRKNWVEMGNKMLGPVNPETGLRPGKTFYLPEVRVGDWHLAWKMPGEDQPHHEAFKTQASAAKRLKELQGSAEWVKPFNAKDRADRFRGMVQEDVSAVQQDALDALYNSVLSSISMDHPEAQEIIDQIKKEVQPAAAFANIAVSPYMREREFIPGREKLNMVEGMVRYVDASAYNVAKGHVKQASVAALFNPDFRANPNIRNEFQKYINFVTDAEGKEFNLMKNMVFMNYIGLNPAIMLQEPVQQLLTMVPYMIENGMGVGEAYRQLRKGNGLVWQKIRNGQFDSPIHERAYREAVNKRVIDEGFISDLYGETDYDFASRLSSTMGQDKLQDKVDLMRKPLYQLLAVARKTYGLVTAYNSKAAFMSSFDMAYSKSKVSDPDLRYQKAMQFATQATYATMFGGGKAARPMVLQRFGSMTGVGGLMYTLGSYSLNTITMMARLFRKGVADSTITKAEKNAALRAGGVMFATQFALAGALGLPLVAPGLAVLEQLFPGLDARLAVRQGASWLAGLMTDDEDLGHRMADGALRGVLNLSPVDFGSRFQLANVMGVSPYDGFSWDNLAGPAANMLENWGRAVQQGSTGQFGEAVRSASPSSVKNILNLIHDDWAVRDKAGRMITEMTPNEKAWSTLGFKPQRLTEYREAQSIRERSDKYVQQQTQDIRQEAAKLMIAGDMEGARRVIMEGTQKVGPYDPYNMAKEAAELAQDMQHPMVRRNVSRANLAMEKELSRLYPQPAGQAELSRLMQSAALAQQAGLGDRITPGAYRHAALVDQLMRSNPNITPPEARQMVEMMTSRTEQRHFAVR